MTTKMSKQSILERRSELMAELLLQDLGAQFISRPTTSDVGWDLLAGFSNKKGGINTFAVEVKSTERPVEGKIQLSKRTFEKLSSSNIPALLILADVKHNHTYYAWLKPKPIAAGSNNVSVFVTELNDLTKRSLLRELEAPMGALIAG